MAALRNGVGSGRTDRHYQPPVQTPRHGHETSPVLENRATDAIEVPVHPVSALQGAFEESIIDSSEDIDADSNSSAQIDVQARRNELLECEHYDDSWITRWKQKPSARYHPLLKLMAQIVFGLHLLQQQQAKSDEEVVKILQTHVNEVDVFLERTSEDFELATKDIEDRIRYLKVPMANKEVFTLMLDEKKFRTQLLEGNEKIEKIINRTTRAMNAALLDIHRATQANKELGRYLATVRESWPEHKRGISDVFDAMRGNEQGWLSYIKELQSKANTLGATVAQLASVIGEMAKMAASASRRNKTQSRQIGADSAFKSAPSSPPGVRSKFSQEATSDISSSARSSRRSSNLNKPLPTEPEVVAIRGSTKQPAQIPIADKYERPRKLQSFEQSSSKASPRTSDHTSRPRTAGETSSRQSRTKEVRPGSVELPVTLTPEMPRTIPNPLRSNPNPLRSNPPDGITSASERLMADRGLESSPGVRSSGLALATATSNESARTTKSSKNSTPSTALSGVSSQPGVDGAYTLSKNERGRLVRPTLDASERKDSVNGSVHRSGSSYQIPAPSTHTAHSTGFARRLSKRMKHLPRTEDPPSDLLNADSQQHSQAQPPSNNSASYSSQDHISSNPTSQDKEDKRPDSTLGPLPFPNQHSGDFSRPRPSETSSEEQSLKPPSYGSGVAPSVRSIASTGKSRSGLSIRKIFRSRFGKEKVYANEGRW